MQDDSEYERILNRTLLFLETQLGVLESLMRGFDDDDDDGFDYDPDPPRGEEEFAVITTASGATLRSADKSAKDENPLRVAAGKTP